MTRKVHLLIIIALSLVTGWQLLRIGYFPMHDDLQVMRLYEMRRCFNDGQIPCRWSPDMVNNYGQAMFNYYSVFPYYLGMFPNLLGIQFVDTVKILFFLSLALSGIFTYLLTIELISPWAALVAAVAYMVAPYHSVDIFVRGAMSESWGLALVPAVIYFLYQTSKKPKVTPSVGLALSFAALLITHNVTTLISAPILTLCGIYFIFTHPDKIKQLKYVIPGTILGIGLSAFFLLPVFIETSLINPNFLTSNYFSYVAHFVTLSQLFIKNLWGYGPSKFGPDDDLSFAVGYLHEIALFISPFIFLIFYKQKQWKKLWLTLGSAALAVFYLFLTHNRSIFIWTRLPILAYVQFPWRFLGPAMLFTSLLLGLFIDTLKDKLHKSIGLLLVIILVVINFSHFRFEKYWPWIDDTQKLSGELYNLQVRAAMTDYLPKNVADAPMAKAPDGPQVSSGRADINYYEVRSNYFASEFDVAEDDTVVQFPVMYFPGWKVFLDHHETNSFTYNNKIGQITIKLPRGHHLIQGFFENTPVRSIGNVVTFISGIMVIIWLII